MINFLMISLGMISSGFSLLFFIFIHFCDIMRVGDSMLYFWTCLIVFLTIIEAATVELVTVWFIVSAIAALIVSIFIDNLVIQFGVFVILGVILLVTTRPFLIKLLKPKNVKTNLDRVLGEKAIVTEDIFPDEKGEVKIDGKRWTAISKEKLVKGASVRVLKIDGVKLQVEKWED